MWMWAPPGAGKTTLVSTWLARHARKTLWLQMEAADEDPATFFRSLDALTEAVGVGAAEPRQVSADDLADITDTLRRRLQRLVASVPPPWTLVFDNHQEMAADAPLQAAIARVIGELPQGVQWILISREAPPPPYARAVSTQHLAVLDAAALRFDGRETLALTRLHGRPDAMAHALEQAEGWAAGLTLMLLGSPADAAAPSVGARQRLFDYFGGEVLARMSDSEQRALGAIALLPRVTGDLAVRMSGESWAPALLERLATASLFTDRRDASEPVFVFHALFAEFLRRRLEQALPPTGLRALKGLAGNLLVEVGDVDAGFDRLMEAGDTGQAEACLRAAAARYVAEGRTAALRRRIDALPEAAQRRLAYWRGVCMLDTDPAGALADLVIARRAAEQSGDVEGQLAAAAAAAQALVARGQLLQLDSWIGIITRHAAEAATIRDDDTELCLVPGLLAALVYRAPWHPLIETLAERAERLLHLDAVAGQRLLVGPLTLHLLWRGHLDRLELVLLRIDAMCAGRNAAPTTMKRWWDVSVSVKALIGQHGSARADAEQAIALVEKEPSVASQRASAELMAVFAALAVADGPTARRHLRNAAAWLNPQSSVEVTAYERQRGMLAMLEGDTLTALRLSRAAVASARASGFHLREHIALIANALAAAHADAHDEARAILDEVFAHPFHAVCRWHHWVAGAVAAYAALRRGARQEALDHLRLALAVARTCGFRHSPILLCCSDLLPRIAALALRHGIEPEVARDIVLRNDLKAPPEADAEWPWTIRLRLLGALEVERRGAPLPAARKESRRLLDLLRVLAAFGASPAPQDRVADALWPDSDGDAARNALDTAVHRLRRLLDGDDIIVSRGGALQLNPQRCWSDVREVEALLGRLESAPSVERAEAAAALRRLYRGPLLPDDPLPLIAERRASLHRRVQAALQGSRSARVTATAAESVADP